MGIRPCCSADKYKLKKQNERQLYAVEADVAAAAAELSILHFFTVLVNMSLCFWLAVDIYIYKTSIRMLKFFSALVFGDSLLFSCMCATMRTRLGCFVLAPARHRQF